MDHRGFHCQFAMLIPSASRSTLGWRRFCRLGEPCASLGSKHGSAAGYSMHLVLDHYVNRRVVVGNLKIFLCCDQAGP